MLYTIISQNLVFKQEIEKLEKGLFAAFVLFTIIVSISTIIL